MAYTENDILVRLAKRIYSCELWSMLHNGLPADQERKQIIPPAWHNHLAHLMLSVFAIWTKVGNLKDSGKEYDIADE